MGKKIISEYNTLTNIDLSKNHISDNGANVLAIALLNPDCKVTEINFSKSTFSENAIAKLKEALGKPDCKVTNIEFGGSNSKLASEISELLKEKTQAATNHADPAPNPHSTATPVTTAQSSAPQAPSLPTVASASAVTPVITAQSSAPQAPSLPTVASASAVTTATAATTLSPREVLLKAVRDENVDSVKTALAADNFADKAAAAGEALIVAAAAGNVDLVKALLGAEGINVNAANVGKVTPLMFAAARGHEGVVTALLGVEGINVNAANVGGRTALMVAAARGHEGVVNALLGREDIILPTAVQVDELLSAVEGKKAIKAAIALREITLEAGASSILPTAVQVDELLSAVVGDAAAVEGKKAIKAAINAAIALREITLEAGASSDTNATGSEINVGNILSKLDAPKVQANCHRSIAKLAYIVHAGDFAAVERIDAGLAASNQKQLNKDKLSKLAELRKEIVGKRKGFTSPLDAFVAGSKEDPEAEAEAEAFATAVIAKMILSKSYAQNFSMGFWEGEVRRTDEEIADIVSGARTLVGRFEKPAALDTDDDAASVTSDVEPEEDPNSNANASPVMSGPPASQNSDAVIIDLVKVYYDGELPEMAKNKKTLGLQAVESGLIEKYTHAFRSAPSKLEEVRDEGIKDVVSKKKSGNRAVPIGDTKNPSTEIKVRSVKKLSGAQLRRFTEVTLSKEANDGRAVASSSAAPALASSGEQVKKTRADNNFRVIEGVYGSTFTSKETDIINTMKAVILKVAFDHKIGADELKKIIACTRKYGGLSGVEFDANTESNKPSDKAQLKKWKEFSAAIQKENAAVGIYTGRDKNLKNFVGLRAVFALDIVGDDVATKMRSAGDNGAVGEATKLVSEKISAVRKKTPQAGYNGR